MTTTPRLPTGTVTFLFTDIEGSTRLWEAHPDTMRDALAAHDAIFRDVVPRNDGVIFKTVGDAICAAFERPDDALRAAVESQRRLTAQKWPEDIGSIRVRMGIHTGMAQERDDDYFGPAVNRVARFMSIAHGGQILVSGTTEALLRHLQLDVSLRELGEQRLKDLNEPEAAFQVLAEGLTATFPGLTSLNSRANNLPEPISSFIGRVREMAELRRAANQHRLISIVGPGGIGKTRLALQLAAEAIDHFHDGAWIVELAPISDPKLIAQTVADAFRLREQPLSAIDDQLVDFLAKKKLLLVLDNVEHLIRDSAELAKKLLMRCPGLAIIATSREPLHLTGEHVMRLNPMNVDASGARSDGVELFIDRALAVRPDLPIDTEAERRIGRICGRLEGIPLAIELAAARASAFSLPQIEGRLSDRLAILVSQDHTLSERQRTLRAAIDWSFQLLDASERRFARSLAVSAGSFTLEAADAISGTLSAADGIESLVNKSLLVAQPVGDAFRFLFFDAVRQYLLEDVPADEPDPWPARHFAYYASLVERHGERASAALQGEWLEQIGSEINNLRTALDWSFLEHSNDAAHLVIKLGRYWQLRGNNAEGSAWFARAITATALEPALRGALLRRAATFATIRNDYDAGRAHGTAALAAFEEAADRNGTAEALQTLAIIDQMTGDIAAATEHHLASLGGYRAAGNIDGELKAIYNLTLIAESTNDLDWALALLEQGAAIEQRSNDANNRADFLRFRGAFELRVGKLEDAAASYERALAEKRAIGHRFDCAETLNSLAAIYTRQGDLPRATAAARESMAVALDLEVPLLLIVGFEAFCEIALAQQRYPEAARCLELATELRERHSYRHPGHRDIQELASELRRLAPETLSGDATPRRDDDWRAVAFELSSA